jgi:hypothetical protein
MRVHHLNCGTLRPAGGRYTDGRSPVLARARLVCHCLLAESDAGLVLVDPVSAARTSPPPVRA